MKYVLVSQKGLLAQASVVEYRMTNVAAVNGLTVGGAAVRIPRFQRMVAESKLVSVALE